MTQQQQPWTAAVIHTVPTNEVQAAFRDKPAMQTDLGSSGAMLVSCTDGQMLSIEHLTAHEFQHALRERRLMPALIRCKQRSPWAYLLISGMLRPLANGKTEIDGNATGWEWRSIQGQLMSIQEAGITVVYLRDPSHLADTIWLLAKRDRSTQRVRPVREALFEDPATDLLMALPDIGQERADLLLEYTNGYPAHALSALTDIGIPLPPGVPASCRDKARKALRLQNDEYLTVAGLMDNAIIPAPTTKEQSYDHSTRTAA